MLFSIASLGYGVSGTIILFFILALVYLISLTFHEWAHSFVAYKQGDLTPKLAGRLTLNPTKHLDFWGFICFLVAGIGWAKPVPVNPLNFKKFRSGIAKVSIAGVCANAILMVFSSFMYCMLSRVVGEINLAMSIIILFFQFMMEINGFLIVFNLLPIYPFDGFNFITSFMKSNNKFIDFSVRNSFKIIIAIVVVDLLWELIIGYSLLGFIIGGVARWLYHPFELLWFAIFK